VIDHSTAAPRFHHQKIFAQVKLGSRFFAVSYTFSPATRAFDWRHSAISAMSRVNQPLPTAP
jgi:hypothetical protein